MSLYAPLCLCGHPCGDHNSFDECEIPGCGCREYEPDNPNDDHDAEDFGERRGR